MPVERIDGPTPRGGAYSEAQFSRDGEPADKQDANAVEITEYAADGTVLGRTYGVIERSQRADRAE